MLLSEEQKSFYIPPQVKASDLQQNLKLLDDFAIQKLEHLTPDVYNIYKSQDLGADYKYDTYYGNKGPTAITERSLGKGRNDCEVLLGQNLPTHTWCAVKKEKITKDFYNECKILFKLQKTDEEKGIINGTDGYVAMELATGREIYLCLEQRNERNTYGNFMHAHEWPDFVWLEMAIDLAKLIKIEIHDKNVIHKDIKLENFLFDLARKKVAAVDFGFSQECKQDNNVNKIAESSVLVGTVHYIAPELITENYLGESCIYNEATEVYALGMLLRHILLNSYVQEQRAWLNTKVVVGNNVLAVFQKDLHTKLIRSEKSLDTYNKKTLFEIDGELGVMAFLNSMIDLEPSKRPTMLEIIKKLEQVRRLFLTKYRENVRQSREIYTRATAAEGRRLRKLHDEVSGGENKETEYTLEQLKQFVHAENEDDKIIQKVEEMIQQGFDLFAQDQQQLFHLIVTVQRLHHLKVLSYLAEKGIDLEMELSGSTPAMFAASMGLSDVIVKLTELGVDVNKETCISKKASDLAQLGLDKAKNTEEISQYEAVFKALCSACRSKTQEEHSSSDKNALFKKLTFEQRLEINLKKAGLLEYFNKQHDYVSGDLFVPRFNFIW